MKELAKYILVVCLAVLTAGSARATPLPVTMFSDTFTNADNWDAAWRNGSTWAAAGGLYYADDPYAATALSKPTNVSLWTPLPAVWAIDVDLSFALGHLPSDPEYGVAGIDITKDRVILGHASPSLFAEVVRHTVSGVAKVYLTLGYYSSSGVVTQVTSSDMDVGTGNYHLHMSRPLGTQHITCDWTGASALASLQIDVDPTVVIVGDLQEYNLAAYFSRWAFDNVVISTTVDAAPTGGRLAGKLALADFDGDLSLAAVRVDFKQGQNVVDSREIRLTQNPAGYSITDIAPGTYDVVFSACQWLSKVVYGLSFTAGNTTSADASLENGDVDGDNYVGTTDFSIVSANFTGNEEPALSQFITSYWDGPPINTDPVAEYAEIAGCNFDYAMPPYGNPTVAQNQAILDACQQYGLNYIIDDPRMGTKGLDVISADYAAYPAAAGYFIADEPNPASYPTLAKINQYLLQKDPGNLPLIDLPPNYGYELDYDSYVDQFCSIVRPKLLLYNYYALLSDGTLRPGYFTDMEAIRRQGLSHRIPTGFVLLVTPHGNYRNPTDAEIRWQVNTALAYGMKAILYYTYWTLTEPGQNYHDGIINADGTQNAHYAMVQAINSELRVLGPTLIRLTSTGVYHTGTTPIGCSPQPPSGLPVRVTSGGPVVLGVFRHQDGSTWAMVVNRDYQNGTTVGLQFDSSVRGAQVMSPQTGAMTDLPIVSGTATLNLLASDRVLIKLLQ